MIKKPVPADHHGVGCCSVREATAAVAMTVDAMACTARRTVTLSQLIGLATEADNEYIWHLQVLL